ncbi:nuclear transport factor 2 family protein [Kitasatospora brasiliensis]|uniref:nuclear transport factor 2 family protein n=1 Tax=Kitasatospora brasiliensis TaxID=3058040 RepID=UPI00292DD46A|nr:nuclear transport factor 2 family protein [Kitasatospora sp. K002]
MQHADARTVVTDYVTLIAAGEREAAIALFAEDATWSYPGSLALSRTWRGKREIFGDFLGRIGVLFAADGLPQITLTQVLADGPQAVAEWTTVGTAADGSAYRNHCLGVFTVTDGLITAVREYLDTDHVARTLLA